MEALVHDSVETSLRNWYNIAFIGSKSPKVCFPSSFPIYQGRYKILTSYSFIRKEVNTALHWIKLCSLIFVDSSIIIVNSLSQSPVFFSLYVKPTTIWPCPTAPTLPPTYGPSSTNIRRRSPGYVQLWIIIIPWHEQFYFC